MTLTKIRTAAASSLAAAALLFTLAACSTPAANQPTTSAPTSTATASSSAASEPCAGVKVIVDSASLKQAAADTSVCMPVDERTLAFTVLSQANVKIEGTPSTPPSCACRVNGVPAADFDITHKGGTYPRRVQRHARRVSYWSLWVKPATGTGPTRKKASTP